MPRLSCSGAGPEGRVNLKLRSIFIQAPLQVAGQRIPPVVCFPYKAVNTSIHSSKGENNMLKIDHLTKTYGEKKAVDDLSLHIQPGEL